MNEKNKESIKGLKGIVMDLHRSAGELDNVIQKIESICEGQTDEIYVEAIIKAEANYRQSSRKILFGNLDEKENEIWKNI